MNLIKVRRNLMLHQNIFFFNILHKDYFGDNNLLTDNFDSIYKIMLENLKDNYLKVASLPLNNFYSVIDYAILILIINTKNYSISGKLMQRLNKKFSINLIKVASKKTLPINMQLISQYLFDLIQLVGDDNIELFFNYLRQKFALEVFGDNCHEAIRLRVPLRFDKHIIDNDNDSKISTINNIFGLYSTQIKKTALFYSANILFPNYFK
jgi:hypothetical protein